ncbi:MAG: 4-diphosphocytidyl-2C-methyl-D-erythritolkinase [Desulfomicrobiaceae bacterium]|jgi:4-diphosphocytidyl-2-C-methyl-D-erythritol kinase|nr:4-(cytidine 5'-diphospho)-2-C-methyl-D-erythritol kinase [Desulfomicrobiaceae bacterium]MBZ4685312.1 4-diphosphocytidyl-2C-methyl-D-erythritolkinase [Desulfomicrobiaceae bacterium]
MTTATLRVGCKVNLYLRITGRRPDGMHTIESLFYPMPVPADTLHVEVRREPGITVSCRLPFLRGQKNILAKAYHAYVAAAGSAPGLAVRLEKRIPVGAGLGGGSSNAAALLSWLDQQTQALGPQRLRSVAAQVGADVPFFLLGRPAWVTGIGECMEPVDLHLDDYARVIISPRVRVNTAWAYRRWDEAASLLTPRSAPDKEAALAKPPVLWNDFEEVVFARFPVIGRIKAAVLESGAISCVMSGSGSNLFALFASAKASAAARRWVEKWQAGWHEVPPGASAYT